MIFRLFIFSLLLSFLIACNSEHPNNSNIQTSIDSVSYALGTDIARHYQDQGFTLNSDLIYQGFRDKSNNDSLKLTRVEIQRILEYYASQLNVDNPDAYEQKARENRALQRDFLNQNLLKEGVNILPSGLQYKVIQEGSGEPPKLNHEVKVDYSGRLLNGEVFTPPGVRDLQLSEMLPGLQEVLTLMRPGDHWEVYIPSELAWGDQSRSQIPPSSLLIFDLKMIKIL